MTDDDAIRSAEEQFVEHEVSTYARLFTKFARQFSWSDNVDEETATAVFEDMLRCDPEAAELYQSLTTLRQARDTETRRNDEGHGGD